MLDAVELLKTRRSVKPRDMTGPGPTPQELETILTIGSRVPDHGRVTPWRFIVFEGEARNKASALIADIFVRKNPEAAEEDIDRARKAMSNAPLVIAVVSSPREHPKVPPWEQELSAGASAMSLVIAANALGYVANWLTTWFAFDRDVMTAFGLKPEERFAGFIHIGSVDQKPEDRARPALADIVTRFG
ncbi:MAG TPA: nitroreductase [Xanthobacteraceae bacterium]|nr:nitroreductase [Xanthobacteraceae bacterium]